MNISRRYSNMCIELNKTNRTVTIDTKVEHFTTKEFDILSYLMNHPDTIISAEDIYQNVWNEVPFKCRAIICVHIRHIREKIEKDPSSPLLLDSFWKKGYRFNSKFIQA